MKIITVSIKKILDESNSVLNEVTSYKFLGFTYRTKTDSKIVVVQSDQV